LREPSAIRGRFSILSPCPNSVKAACPLEGCEFHANDDSSRIFGIIGLRQRLTVALGATRTLIPRRPEGDG
jgi:hypothetical protein